jgi:hypothetical protein
MPGRSKRRPCGPATARTASLQRTAHESVAQKHGQRVGRRHLQTAPVLVVDQGLLDGPQFVGLLRMIAEVAVELADRHERRLPGDLDQGLAGVLRVCESGSTRR